LAGGVICPPRDKARFGRQSGKLFQEICEGEFACPHFGSVDAIRPYWSRVDMAAKLQRGQLPAYNRESGEELLPALVEAWSLHLLPRRARARQRGGGWGLVFGAWCLFTDSVSQPHVLPNDAGRVHETRIPRIEAN